MTLLEQYAKRITVAEKVYSDRHEGKTLSNSRKLLVAQSLDNVNRFLTESFSNSVGTQRADLGAYKKFCLNLTNVVVPNLIAPELVITKPMTSISGFITYLEYTLGTNKGESKRGTVINSPFALGDVDVNYTSSLVVEEVTVGAGGAATLAWFPIFTKRQDLLPVVVGGESGQEVTIVDEKTGSITISGVSEGEKVKVKYAYDNVIIPQNDLPIINVQMKDIALTAKARRVAVYYSQIAAFQAKTDYGFDLGDQLAEKAAAELSYEIDTEVTNLLVENAAEEARLSWSDARPVGISLAEHYESFNRVIERAKRIIYDRTKRFMPNYMLAASDVMEILPFLKGFKAAPVSSMNGPFFAGTLNGIKVFVTPNIEEGTFVLGVNGDDLMSSAAVYAPYMPIVPTQLLGYADGGMSQGWSTMYALEMLNPLLLAKGHITHEAELSGEIIQTRANNA
jgi:hypothetical protein